MEKVAKTMQLQNKEPVPVRCNGPSPFITAVWSAHFFGPLLFLFPSTEIKSEAEHEE
jgi:hypothetical protein